MLKFLHKKLTKKKWKAFRKILKPVFRDQIPDSMLTQLHIFFLHLLSKSKSGGRFLPIVSLSDASSRTGYLKPPEKFTTEAPQALGTKKVQRISQFTTIDFKLLNRVFAHPQSSVLLKDDKVCVPDYYLERYDFNICDQILLFLAK